MLFPSEAPDEPTGPGAIVWPAGPGCPGGAGARVQAILPGRPPAAPLAPAGQLAPTGMLSAAAANEGRIAIAGTDPRRRAGLLVVEGTAGGRFAPLLEDRAVRGGAAMSTAYLGDLALLTRSGTSSLSIHVERWFGGGLGAPRRIATRSGAAAGALTVAMDFRSDALAAWAQDGSIWVSEAPQKGAARAATRLGPAGTDPHIAALLSDDNRGIVMWTDTAEGTTRVWLDYSATGPRFGRPRLLESFAAPVGTLGPSGSPQLIRLSSEGVMAAWAGVAAGRWVVRTAPLDQHGLGTVGTIPAPGGDLLLYALAPAPNGDALALLGEPRAGTVALLASRGTESAGHTQFSALEAVGEASSPSGATVSVEPGTDRAVAAWRGAEGRVYYSLRDTP